MDLKGIKRGLNGWEVDEFELEGDEADCCCGKNCDGVVEW